MASVNDSSGGRRDRTHRKKRALGIQGRTKTVEARGVKEMSSTTQALSEDKHELEQSLPSGLHIPNDPIAKRHPDNGDSLGMKHGDDKIHRLKDRMKPERSEAEDIIELILESGVEVGGPCLRNTRLPGKLHQERK